MATMALRQPETKMVAFAFRWILNAAILLGIACIVPGVHIDGFWGAMIAVCIIGLVNIFIKPIFILLTLPVTVVTLGLFLFFVNSILFYFAGHVSTSFHVDGAWAAIFGSLIYGLIRNALRPRQT